MGLSLNCLGGWVLYDMWELGSRKLKEVEDWEVGNWRSEDRGGKKKKIKNNIGQRKKTILK